MSFFLSFSIASLVFLLLLFLYNRWLVRGMVGQTVDGCAGSKAQFLYFHSPHCSGCRSITPQVAQFRSEGVAVDMVDVSEQRELARACGVRITPSLLRVEEGRVVAVMAGTMSNRRLASFLGVKKGVDSSKAD